MTSNVRSRAVLVASDDPIPKAAPGQRAVPLQGGMIAFNIVAATTDRLVITEIGESMQTMTISLASLLQTKKLRVARGKAHMRCINLSRALCVKSESSIQSISPQSSILLPRFPTSLPPLFSTT
mmetsp:Transcript_114162/g.179726  ORF Transcript_114162/g.179726 Transcript_114162/m.179726 type:complete len:124 (-) Transcript_114162:2107-2478(-)